MNIETIKEYKNVYIINDTHPVPKNEELDEFKEVQDWISNGGIVERLFKTEEELQRTLKEDYKSATLISLRAQRDYFLAALDVYSLRALEGKADLNRLGVDNLGNEHDVIISEVLLQKEKLRKCTDELKALDLESDEENVILQKIEELGVLNFDPLENLK